MKKKNAFTLIELLAIIVILAIIAVITVPIILNIIDNSKKGAAQDSAYGYKDAINKMYVSKLTENPDYSIPNNSYDITQLKNMGVTVSGQEPDSNSWILIENNDASTGCLQFDEYKVNITEGKVGEAEKGKCSPKLTISGDGLYESLGEPGRYVYRGADPDNYINLKENGTNVTYRIVSYESDGTIKVVREERINESGNAWDGNSDRYNDQNTYCTIGNVSNGCNVWGNQANTYYNGQTLNKLNQDFYFYYYENNQATNFSIKPESIFGTVTQDSALNTYLNNTWINTLDFKDDIETHSFYVGELFYYNGYTGRDKELIKEKEEEKTFKWNGKIGLLNITEFVESSTNQNCTSVYQNYVYALNSTNVYSAVNFLKNNLPTEGWPCKNNNFNYKDYNQWSISAYSYYKYGVWYMNKIGFFDANYAGNTISARPAFYLKSSVKLGGLGTSDEPYYIES